MGRKYAIRDQEKFYLVTFTVIHWMDVFIRDEYRNIFIESIKFCQKEKGLQVGAWCLMTNHVHLIIGSDGQMKLADIIRDLKSYTSRHIRKSIEGNVQESCREWLLRAMYKTGANMPNFNCIRKLHLRSLIYNIEVGLILIEVDTYLVALKKDLNFFGTFT